MTDVNKEVEEEVIIPKKTTKEVPEKEEPQGKVFSEDYVKQLREEAKEHRLAKKAMEAKLRGVIGLNDDEDLDDSKISAYQKGQAEAISGALSKANARLITAEIKSLDGYDSKLVERLLDRSTLKIEEDGTVTGLKEAIEGLLKEFPQIRVAKQGGVNPPPPGTRTEEDEYADLVKKIRANPNDSFLKQQLFILRERMKK